MESGSRRQRSRVAEGRRNWSPTGSNKHDLQMSRGGREEGQAALRGCGAAALQLLGDRPTHCILTWGAAPGDAHQVSKRVIPDGGTARQLCTLGER
jgi:hypothetical protein